LFHADVIGVSAVAVKKLTLRCSGRPFHSRGGLAEGAHCKSIPPKEQDMNKTILIGAVIVALAGGGYYQFVHLPQQAAAAAALAKAEAEAAAALAAQEAEAKAKAEAEAAAEAAAKAEEEAKAAAAKLEEEAKAAAEAAAAAAAAAANTATQAVTDAATQATEAAAQAAEAATEAAAQATEAATNLAAALDPSNFNAETVKQLIDTSALDAGTKLQLSALVDGAANNPALLEATLTQIKAALGL
jgi:colicin import membrane protein